MRYLIVSDIHGSLTSLQTVLKHFNEKKCDLLCILGDILNYGPRNGVPEDLNAPAIVELLNEMSDKIIAVRGNCDSEVDQMLLKFPIMADYALIVDQGKRLFLTHGHVYNESNLPNLAIDAFFYGHTHMQKLEKTLNGQIICNTGSVTFPKGGNPKTFAIYENGKVTMCKL
ncbi:MAG: phosphodiesterase [Bacteroidaceae bacterium]|nr:phosphodiesterase [Bacteroidaceae bacterium]